MDLIADLNRLGASSRQVANSLGRQGVRGVRADFCHCPVAVYLHRLHPGHRFEVDRKRVQIDGDGRGILPDAVARFVRDFDNGDYPDLISPADQEVESDA